MYNVFASRAAYHIRFFIRIRDLNKLLLSKKFLIDDPFMKYLLLFLLFPILITQSFGQISNVKSGIWSDQTVWSNNTIPTIIDDIVLNFNIVVDVDAVCQSLTTNGHHVTVSTGVIFNISGKKNVTNPTDNLLKKFILLDTTQSSPNDTIYIYSYTYDTAGRCTQIKINDFKNNSIGYTYNYYSGNDPLITSRKLINQVYSDSVFEFFKYTIAGELLSDSVLQYHSTDTASSVYKYQSIANSVTSTITANGQPFIIGKYLLTRDNMGNIISEKDSSFSFSNYSGSYHYSTKTDIQTSYDTHPCPFYKLYPKRLIELDYELVAVDDLTPHFGILQKNNVISKVSATLPATSGFANWNNTYQYTYNSNGFPSIVIYSELLFGDIYKGIYYY